MAATPEELAHAAEQQQLAREHAERMQQMTIEAATVESRRREHIQAVQLAGQALIETKRSLPVGQRAITPQEILAYAEQLKLAE